MPQIPQRMVLSTPPEASRVPSSGKATVDRIPVPIEDEGHCRRSHARRVPSPLPEAKRVPSLEKAMESRESFASRISERPHSAKVGIFVYTKFDRFVNILSA